MKNVITILKASLLTVLFLFFTQFAFGQLINENFEYPIGSLLTANGWTAHSGAGTQAITVTDGLSFNGYVGSAIGGAALLDNTGEDVHRTFSPQTSGNIYAAFVIQTESTNSAGYFLHFGQTTISTIFFTRVWVNATGNGVGIGANAPATYIPISAGVPTLLVAKLNYETKVSSLYVFNSFPSAEPATPDATFIETANYTNVGSIALRQYHAAQRIIVDGIRIATTWNDAVTPGGGNPMVATPTFNPPGGTYYASQNVTLSTTTPDASIYYTTDGTDPDQNSTLFTNPIPVNQTVTIKARAYADGLDPSFVGQATYTLPVTVANLSQLRSSPLNGLYYISGQVVLSFKQTFRNQKYIQDAGAGVLIDDLSGVITTNYNVGDGITGIYGTLNLFGNMLQFTPVQDPGASTSTGNPIVPVVITLAQLNSNFDNYESRVVQINSVSFTTPGVNFANGIVYAISDVSDATANFRTTFFDVNYIGTPIPSGSGSIIGIPNARSEGNYLTSRSSDDLVFNPCFSIAQLRAGTVGQQYTLTCEAILTYKQEWRNQKFVQDETAAILLDDATGIITTNYNIGDGITGISGTLVNSNGMLRLAVNANPGPPTSTNNVITPEVVTLAQLNANFMNYQSELVRIQGVTFANGGQNFVEGTNYPISDASADASGIFRTEFFDANYLYNPIPTGSVDLIVIPNTVSNANYVTSRFSSDIISLQPAITVTSPNGYEFWERGTAQNITWTSQNFTGNVKITLVRPPLYTLVIADNYPNAGFFSWTIPANQQTASTYKIRIQGAANGSPIDESNDPFSIVAEMPVPKIVINEIMYNPSNANPVMSDSYYEYLELYNNGTFNVDLSGWTISNAIVHTFAAGTSITPGQYLVLAVNADSVATYYGISNVIKWTSGGLNNTGETIELKAPNGTLMDAVSYSSSAPWPSGANGLGSSLELIHPDLDNSLVENWIASITNLGTPGIQNSAYGFQGLTVTAPNGGETFNQGTTTDITWTRVNFNGLIKIELFNGEVVAELLANNLPAINGTWTWNIPAGQPVGTNFKIRISDVEDGVPMDESNGTFIIASPTVPSISVLTPNGGESIQQGTNYNITWSTANYTGTVAIELLTSAKSGVAIPLGTAPSAAGTFAWNVTQDPGSNYLIKISDQTTGSPSDQSDAVFAIQLPPQQPKVVINEIMYNPPESGTDSLEYIELYNLDNIAHNLQGWTFSKGVTYTFPMVSINPGGYLVVAIKASAMMNVFGVSALQWAGGGLANGGEEVELKDNQGNVIDYVNFSPNSPWPAAGNGHGPSLSLKDPLLDNALPASWAPETVKAAVNAAGIPVYGTPGAPNFPVPAQSMLIPMGWGGISSYITPAQPSMIDVMQPIVNNLVIMQNFNQLYFPFYNINTIGNWNNNIGYQLKTDALRYHVISGTPVASKTVNLVTGWNGLPVLSECEVNASALFSGIPGVVFVKDMGSDQVYWPDGGLFSLEQLVPGKAYFIKVAGPVSITFPECLK